MLKDGKIWMAQSDAGNIYLEPKMANRHGLIAGATGTGKTITMKVMAESFSDLGVPVFFSDVKGDLSGMICPGEDTEDMRNRITRFGIENWRFQSYPTAFWDIFGTQGIPVRVSVSDMGPSMLARLFDLSDVQAGVLNIVFKIADDNGLELIDLKDLRKMLTFVGNNRKEFITEYGQISTASVGAIQRALLSFEEEGGDCIFGETSLEIEDFLRTDETGRGYINVLNSTRLILSPTVYATFLLWLLTKLFEVMPEIGDPEKPKMIFFFDEAHLLFNGAKKALVSKIVQVVKLIRSKGIGVYFVTQSPSDVPDEVLAQLSNRVQHGLRAYTPAEQKNIRAAAKAFRANPKFDSEVALSEIGTGQALISFLDGKGIPTIVEKANVLPPESLMGPASEEDIQKILEADPLNEKYRVTVDRISAYEIISEAEETIKREEEQAALDAEAEKQAEKERKAAEKKNQQETDPSEASSENGESISEKSAKIEEKLRTKKKTESAAAKAAKSTVKSAVNSAANTVTHAASTNVVNSLTGGKITDPGTIAKRAATNALSAAMRGTVKSIFRGILGNKK